VLCSNTKTITLPQVSPTSLLSQVYLSNTCILHIPKISITLQYQFHPKPIFITWYQQFIIFAYALWAGRNCLLCSSVTLLVLWMLKPITHWTNLWRSLSNFNCCSVPLHRTSTTVTRKTRRISSGFWCWGFNNRQLPGSGSRWSCHIHGLFLVPSVFTIRWQNRISSWRTHQALC